MIEENESNCFDDIPEDKKRSFPCECGGNITLFNDKWSCDECDFLRENVK